MANKQRGEVEVKLAGRTWTMRPAFGALAEIEGRTGLGIAAVVQRFTEGRFGIDDVAAVIAAGIGAAHDDAPDFESVKRAVVEEGFNKCAVVAAEFLAGALAGAASAHIGGQTKKVRPSGNKSRSPGGA